MTVLLPSHLMYGCIAPKLVRDVVAGGLIKIEYASVEDISLLLGVTVSEALPVWEGLVSDGWVVEKNGHWMAADNIRSLANAKFGKPMKRDMADAMIAKILENTADLNADHSPENLLWVTQIAVFGSYLSEKSDLGDLDIAWAYTDRKSGEKSVVQMILRNKDYTTATRAKVFPRTSKLSLHTFRELTQLNCPHRILYEFEPPDA